MSVVLITGCGSGFGAATALAFARRGDRVFAGVRNREQAAALVDSAEAEGLSPELIELDVTDRKAIQAAVAGVIASAGRIDVLINNAGIAATGAFEDIAEDVLQRIFNTNLYGPIWLTRAVLPHMREQQAGRIIMVSSLSALVGLPGDSAYAASKAALEAAAESLRYEVERFGIRVSVIEPGLFNTAMPAKMAETASCPEDSAYQPLIAHLMQRLRSRLGEGDDPQRVAELLIEIVAAERPAFRYPAGGQAEQVVPRIIGLDATAREALIREVGGTEWWSAGRANADS